MASKKRTKREKRRVLSGRHSTRSIRVRPAPKYIKEEIEWGLQVGHFSILRVYRKTLHDQTKARKKWDFAKKLGIISAILALVFWCGRILYSIYGIIF